MVEAFAKFRITDPLLFFQTVNNEQGVQARLRSIITPTRDSGSTPLPIRKRAS